MSRELDSDVLLLKMCIVQSLDLLSTAHTNKSQSGWPDDKEGGLSCGAVEPLFAMVNVALVAG